MEELLNKLIEKGWKPFGSNCERYEHGCLIHEFTTKDGVYSYGQYPTTLREFCAKESLLRQFVCENELIKSETGVWVNAVDGMYKEILINQYDYRYRIIESALCDEDKLESFLLQNIVIKDE